VTTPAFYINLRRRPDRRAWMEQQSARLGLALERVEATTPADIPPAEIAAAAPWLGQGELACTYSHRSIWRLIAERNLPHALVLEDDCVLAPELVPLLADPELMAPGIDLIQLETHPSRAVLGRRLPTAAPGITKRRMMSSALGGGAYLIRGELARALIDDPDLIRFEMGVFLFGRNGPNLYRHRVFQAFPAVATPLDVLVTADAGRSDLGPMGLRNPDKRSAPRRRSRGSKLATLLRHAQRSVRVFGLGEMLAARHVEIPFAGDASLAADLPKG
jgi:glycosyl transferase family 25